MTLGFRSFFGVSYLELRHVNYIRVLDLANGVLHSMQDFELVQEFIPNSAVINIREMLVTGTRYYPSTASHSYRRGW